MRRPRSRSHAPDRSIGDGSQVRWMPASTIPAELAEQLRDGDPRRREPSPPRPRQQRPPACFVVPALGADRTLVGAFYIDNG
jgi:hypothetical protein